jgi:hypothetical protein
MWYSRPCGHTASGAIPLAAAELTMSTDSLPPLPKPICTSARSIAKVATIYTDRTCAEPADLGSGKPQSDRNVRCGARRCVIFGDQVWRNMRKVAAAQIVTHCGSSAL